MSATARPAPTILVVTAVDAERNAVVRELGMAQDVEIAGLSGLCVDTPAGVLHAFTGGVGPVASAVTTATLLAATSYELVVCAGIAGGFRGRVEIGDIVVADRVTFADLGVRTDDGFRTPRDIGLSEDTTYELQNDAVAEALLRGTPSVVRGEVLTLACMTGTEPDAEELARRHADAVAEAMEGFGVVAAALRQRKVACHVTEIRAISNLIGRRDRSTWDIPRAFDALAKAFATLVKEPLP